MSVETNAKFITELNEAYPRKGDLIKEGDDHLRLIKGILKNTLPGLNRTVNFEADKLNQLDGLTETTAESLTIKGNFTVADKKTINMGGNTVKGVSDPVDDTDVVNKQYMKSEGVGSSWPVDSIYFTVDSRNPSDILGVGTWEKFASGRVIIGTGSDKDESGIAKLIGIGAKGGNYSETLSGEHLPNHTHSGEGLTLNIDRGGSHRHGIRTQQDRMSIHDIIGRWFRGAGSSTDYTEVDGEHTHTGTVTGNTGATGGGKAHNNMMPWIGVHIWKRTK